MTLPKLLDAFVSLGVYKFINNHLLGCTRSKQCIDPSLLPCNGMEWIRFFYIKLSPRMLTTCSPDLCYLSI